MIRTFGECTAGHSPLMVKQYLVCAALEDLVTIRGSADFLVTPLPTSSIQLLMHFICHTAMLPRQHAGLTDSPHVRWPESERSRQNRWTLPAGQV
jgi:hypothetical protein